MNKLSFCLKLLMWTVCVLGVSSERGVNNTKKYSEIIKSLSNFPETFLLGYKDADISPNCKTAIKLYVNALENYEGWALQMFDAMSKLQSGILAGNFYNLGAYDECQSIRDIVVHSQDPDNNEAESSTLINGKYCLGKGVLAEIPLVWAMCAPDACSAVDLNKIIKILPISMEFTEEKCHDPSQNPKITNGDIAAMTCFGIILAIMVTTSLYDMYLRYFIKKSFHPLLLAFSMVTNSEKLFATKEPDTGGDQMECLSGIRSLSMMWVVLGHTFSNVTLVAIANYSNLKNIFTDAWTMYVRGATVAVDSFFLMSGIVMIYVYLKSSKNKQTFNVFLYYLHRYLRLTPALAAVLVIHITVIKHFGSGPYWYLMNDAIKDCQNYWYSVLLYIQNYVNDAEICMIQSWYLSVDTQLFLLSPLVLFPIKRWPRITLAAVAIAALASISTGFAVAWVYKLTDINMLNTDDPDASINYMKIYYHATYTRASPWLTGIIVGYFIYKVKIVQREPFKINWFLNISLWIASLCVLATCVFVDKALDGYDRLAVSSYIAFIRPAWSLALSWVIFACVTGYGGPVNALLSARVFQVMARLTYSMYVTHYTIIFVLYTSIKQPLAFSNSQYMLEYWSIFALVFVISVIWTLAFESPIIIIEKYIFGGANRRRSVISSQHSNYVDKIGDAQIIENFNIENGLHRSLNGVEKM